MTLFRVLITLLLTTHDLLIIPLPWLATAHPKTAWKADNAPKQPRGARCRPPVHAPGTWQQVGKLPAAFSDVGVYDLRLGTLLGSLCYKGILLCVLFGDLYWGFPDFRKPPCRRSEFWGFWGRALREASAVEVLTSVRATHGLFSTSFV